MTINLPSEKTFEIVPAGTHVAICNKVVDLGTQESQFGAKAQILLGFELAEERTKDGRPFQITRRYGFSADRRSAFRGDLEAWFGRALTADDFGKLDLGTLLGKTALLGIRHDSKDGRTYANISTVMKPPKGTPDRMSPDTGAVAFSLSDRPFAQGDFDALPTWIQDLVKRSPEYQAAVRPIEGSNLTEQLRNKLGSASVAIADDDVPF